MALVHCMNRPAGGGVLSRGMAAFYPSKAHRWHGDKGGLDRDDGCVQIDGEAWRAADDAALLSRQSPAVTAVFNVVLKGEGLGGSWAILLAIWCVRVFASGPLSDGSHLGDDA